MTIDTQLLIIQLLGQESRRANHPATRPYHKEIEEAKQDFIGHCSKLPAKTTAKE